MAEGLRFRFEIEPNDVLLSRAISRLGEYATDLRPLWDRIQEDLRDSERKQFDSEGKQSGRPWAPLSPRYAAWKAKHYPGNGILVRTGRLRIAATGTGGELEVRKSQREFLWRLLVPYAKYHQGGTSRMPQRRPVDLSDTRRRSWTKLLQRHLVEARNKALAGTGKVA